MLLHPRKLAQLAQIEKAELRRTVVDRIVACSCQLLARCRKAGSAQWCNSVRQLLLGSRFEPGHYSMDELKRLISTAITVLD